MRPVSCCASIWRLRMPDQDLLPPGRRFDEATPPGLGEVLTSARRRRRVRAGVIGGIVGACAVAAVALLAVPDSSTGSLKTVTPAVSPTPPSIAHKEPRTLQPIEQPAAAAT